MALVVDSASNRNEYQECFLGVKVAGAYSWQPYHLSVLIVLKSGSLNLLEPSGPVQVCNGIALPLPFISEGYTKMHGQWNKKKSKMFVTCPHPLFKMIMTLTNLLLRTSNL